MRPSRQTSARSDGAHVAQRPVPDLEQRILLRFGELEHRLTVRFASGMRRGAKGKGKRGGARAITYYGGPDLPVFLLTVFAKGAQASLTKAERNELREVLGRLAAEYRERANRDVEGGREHP